MLGDIKFPLFLACVFRCESINILKFSVALSIIQFEKCFIFSPIRSDNTVINYCQMLPFPLLNPTTVILFNIDESIMSVLLLSLF